jgi:hypothetical protein
VNNGKKPPSLASILRGDDDFQKAWDEAPSTPSDRDPLPAGRYRCLVADGRLAESRQKSTPSYKVAFEVVEGEHTGRKVFLDLWLSPAALRISKPQLIALGFGSAAELQRDCPALGSLAEVDVVLRADDQGRQWNEVRAFKIVEAAPADDFAPAEMEDNGRAAGEGAAGKPKVGGGFEL